MVVWYIFSRFGMLHQGKIWQPCKHGCPPRKFAFRVNIPSVSQQSFSEFFFFASSEEEVSAPPASPLFFPVGRDFEHTT
jgi:hypothetical protein